MNPCDDDHVLGEFSSKKRLMYVSAVYPVLSETFVAREIDGLRARGWMIKATALRQPEDVQLPSAQSRSLDLCITGRKTSLTLARATLEVLNHPLSSTRTLLRGLIDAILPGERMPLRRRGNIVVLAYLSLGVARWCRRESIGHIHAHFANGPSTVALYASTHLKIPFSFTGHANDIFDRRSLLVRKLQRARFVACISEWHRDWYASQAGASNRYIVIRCGVSEIPVGSEHARRAEQREHYEALTIICVARMIEKKGIDTLIRALAVLKREDSRRWRVQIVGDGPLEDSLRKLATELGCSNDVEFLGQISNDDVYQALSRADFFALPCRTDISGDRDGIPVALMEAMVAGLPVIAGDLPAIRELVVHGETGLIIPPDGVPQLAAALLDLASRPDYRDSLTEAARERVAGEFSAETNLDRLEACILGTKPSSDTSNVAV